MSNGGTLSARLISLGSSPFSASISALAQKARPAPVSTITRTPFVRSCLHGLTDVALHDRRPRIHAVGAVERDGRDLLIHVIEDVLIAHGDLLGRRYCPVFREPLGRARYCNVSGRSRSQPVQRLNTLVMRSGSTPSCAIATP